MKPDENMRTEQRDSQYLYILAPTRKLLPSLHRPIKSWNIDVRYIRANGKELSETLRAMINLRVVAHTLALLLLISLANVSLLLALLLKPVNEKWSWNLACGTA